MLKKLGLDICPSVIVSGSCETMKKHFSYKVDDFNSREDGEASEESHGPTNKTKLGFQSHLERRKGAFAKTAAVAPWLTFKCYLNILFNFVVGGRVEMDLKELQLSCLGD